MRLLFTTIISIYMLAFASCGNNSAVGQNAKPVPFSISGSIGDPVSDSIGLFIIRGSQYKAVMSAALDNENGGKFEMKGDIPQYGVYYLGMNMQTDNPQGVTVLIDSKNTIELTAIGSGMSATTQFKNSEINANYKKMTLQHDLYQRGIQTAQQQWQQLYRANRKAEAEAMRLKSDSLFRAQAAYFEEIVKGKADFQKNSKSKLLASIAKVYFYKPFGYDEESKAYKNEGDYFISTFLANMDLKDPMLAYIPLFYQKVAAYSGTMMGSYGYAHDQAMKAINTVSEKLEKGSYNHLIFMDATVDGVLGTIKGNPNSLDVYLSLCDQYIASFPNEPRAQNMAKDLTRFGGQRLGTDAKEISMYSPDSVMLKLSSLKGKVVLLDFWASWCKPCRMANPHVVQMYNKYKDKGFEVFSVSLDNNIYKWTAAIKQDGLVWSNHVSDLRGWQSAAAKLYGVSSIPAVFLIDKEGKIAGKNLRGPQLEQKLEELLGITPPENK